MTPIFQRIADELSIQLKQVTAAVGLLDGGATVPFISRYRKEITGSLDDTQMRNLEERLSYLRELEDRRASIVKSINEQGKLSPALANDIAAADTKNQLEDIYLPYKPKRRTKGQIAIEAGLVPLADSLYQDPSLDPEKEASKYLNEEQKITSTKEALDGAKYILMERFSEDAKLLGKLRSFLSDNGEICAAVLKGKEAEGQKFSDYFEHQEPLKGLPSHRALALFRARNEGILSLNLVVKMSELADKHPCEITIAEHWQINHQHRPADAWLAEVVRWTWRIKLLTHIETDLFAHARELAETDAINVFANNLNDLLLAAPAGQKGTIGLDPGLRSGVKVAVIDATGKVLDYGAIFPNQPQKRLQEAEGVLVNFCQKYQVELIAIGNGTASRETEAFANDVLKRHPELKAKTVIVNESGASIYSASEFAAKEFPDLDVTIRGAISIARRLQDPLAELVKIEPKSIGVGQYQHDVSQAKLAKALSATVEDCVNAVGVEVNTASAPLLARVSGLNQTIANNIVEFRDIHGRFTHREQLKGVPRLGDKTYEQAIGFLRISNAENPLDASAVHPESYAVVEAISQYINKPLAQLLNDTAVLRTLQAKDFTNERFGLPTVEDIFRELEKPGRDPRPEFKTASFKAGIETIKDLKPAMILEGVITNVTNFGAFVDIGVHQDGLVHISALSNTFVKDPRTIVKAGDIVSVKVMEVDITRKRIGLSMRLDDDIGKNAIARSKLHKKTSNDKVNATKSSQSTTTAAQGSMGDLLKAAMNKQQ
ncbi:MAG: hypothetical protein ACI9D5_001131 [Candidatus Endobugula sp.]|jgi:uncharacterized protein